MKISHQPPAVLSDEVVQNDQDYWTKSPLSKLAD